jgi:hypothetical protein
MAINNYTISEAIITLRPNAEFLLNGDTFDGLEWLDKEQSAPTWDEVLAEINNPTPKVEPSIEEKLASVGLDFNELKAAILGGN